MPRSAMSASVFHTFWPLMTHSSPSRTARAERPARSEPALGSLKSWHQASSPVNMGLSSRSFASSSPKVTTVGPAIVRPKKCRVPMGGAPAVRSRDSTARWCDGGSPRPPLPSGKWTHARPRSYCRPRNSTGSVVAGSSSSSSCSRRSETREAASVMPEPYELAPETDQRSVRGRRAALPVPTGSTRARRPGASDRLDEGLATGVDQAPPSGDPALERAEHQGVDEDPDGQDDQHDGEHAVGPAEPPVRLQQEADVRLAGDRDDDLAGHQAAPGERPALLEAAHEAGQRCRQDHVPVGGEAPGAEDPPGPQQD